MAPPPKILRELKLWGKRTPGCMKSSRAVIVYDPSTGAVASRGYNAPPIPYGCDGTDACRRDCSKICIHAEAMAINHALHSAPSSRDLELVHGKFENGELVAGGGPSCWQCSKQILEVSIAAVWLYERMHLETFPVQIVDKWRRYTGLEFHQMTLANCDLWDNLR